MKEWEHIADGRRWKGSNPKVSFSDGCSVGFYFDRALTPEEVLALHKYLYEDPYAIFRKPPARWVEGTWQSKIAKWTRQVKLWLYNRLGWHSLFADEENDYQL